MPSVFRLLVILGILVGGCYLAMLALVAFVDPEPHEIIQPLPSARLNK